MELLNNTLPDGIRVNKIAFAAGKEKSLDSFISRYVYNIKNDTGLSADGFFEKTEIPCRRNNRMFNMKDMVEDVRQLDRTTFQVTLRDLTEAKVKLSEILQEIFNIHVDDLEVTRMNMYGWLNDGWKEPIEGEKHGQ